MGVLRPVSLHPPVSMKCTESEDEEPIKGKESQLQLSCFINQEVKYLATGLRLVSDPGGNRRASILHTTAVSMVTGGIFVFLSIQRLQEEITKMSTTLERNALYIKSVSSPVGS